MHPSIQDVASSSEAFATQGFIAIAPNGVLYSGSSSLTGLIEDLRMKLPDMAEDYDDGISEGGTWYSFLEYLANLGMVFYLASPTAITAVESNDTSAELVCDPIQGKAWLKSEETQSK